MPTPKTLTHFWEGVDSSGRQVRATFLESPTSLILAERDYPMIIFRGRTVWRRDAYDLQQAAEWTVARNEARALAAVLKPKMKIKQLPPPRESGVTWPVVQMLSLKKFGGVIRACTPLGLASKFSVNMPRISVEQLSQVKAALDFWLERAGSNDRGNELAKAVAGAAP